METNTLMNQSYFDPKARRMSDAELAFAVTDIQEVLDIWRDAKPHSDPYMVKCWAEFDAVTCERQRRRDRARAEARRAAR